MPRNHLYLSFLFLAALFALLPFLGVGDVYQVAEGREGVVVNSILESGDWILPLRNGELVPSKPPLFHWLGALVAKATGEYSQYELRLVSAIAGSLMVLVTFALGECFGGPIVGLLSGMILLSTSGFLRMSADGRVDMLFSLFYMLSVVLWIRAYRKTELDGGDLKDIPDSVYSFLGIFSGFAILGKGPLGVVLAIFVIAAIAYDVERYRGLKSLVRKGWLLAGIVTAPWYLAASVKGGWAFFSRQVLFENVDRFVGGAGISKKPWWFYLEEFWRHAAPWSFVFLGLGIFALWRRAQGGPSILSFYSKLQTGERLGLRITLLWSILLLIFFSLSAGKRTAYLLAILPPLSVSLALLLAPLRGQFIGALLARERFYRSGLGLFLFIFLLCLIALGLSQFPDITSGKKKIVLVALAEVLRTHAVLFVSSFAICFGGGALCWMLAARRGRALPGVIAIFLFLQTIFVVVMNVSQGVRGLTHGYRNLAEQVIGAVPREEKLTFVKKKRDESFDGFFFYMARTVGLFEPQPGNELPTEAGLYLARSEWLYAQPDSFTGQTHEILTSGRRVDSMEKRVVLFCLGACPGTRFNPT